MLEFDKQLFIDSTCANVDTACDLIFSLIEEMNEKQTVKDKEDFLSSLDKKYATQYIKYEEVDK